MIKITALIAVAFAALAFPASAQDAVQISVSPQNEIVYRTNLGRAEDVILLIESGASPNQTDKEGIPVLLLAAARKDPEGVNVVKALVEKGADINITDAKKQTALFYAARNGNAAIVQYLLDMKIDYYATDKSGNVARTVAYNAKHPEIVALMDRHITEQAKAINQQYVELNKTLEARYKELAEQAQKQREQSGGNPETSPKPDTHIIPNPEQTPVPDSQPTSVQLPSDVEGEYDTINLFPEQNEAVPLMQDLAFENCAFQYWSFCRDMKQTSQYKGNDLDGIIDQHKQKVANLSEDIMLVYFLEKKYIERVSNNAKRRVFDQLQSMPSKIYRFEHGVCQTPDLMTRCEEVSKRWNESTRPVSHKPARKGKKYKGQYQTPPAENTKADRPTSPGSKALQDQLSRNKNKE